MCKAEIAQICAACLQIYALAIMDINPGDALLTKLAKEATAKIRGFIAQNLSNTIWCAMGLASFTACMLCSSASMRDGSDSRGMKTATTGC